MLAGTAIVLAGCLEDDKPVAMTGSSGRRTSWRKCASIWWMDAFSIQPSRTHVVFGVPAYQPGWEMDAFANNIRVLRDQKIGTTPLYYGAENPLAAYEILEHLSQTLAPTEQIFVGPIGTKPHGIAAALFAATRDKTGILYDHPRRSADRTSRTYSWHLFNAEF